MTSSQLIDGISLSLLLHICPLAAASAGVSRVRGDVTYVRPVCGFGCILALSLAFWLCLPPCIFLCWPGAFQRPLSWEEQAAAVAAERGWPPGSVLVYAPPPTAYAVYSDRSLSWQPQQPAPRDRPRSSPPDAGSAPKLWEGPSHHMDEEEEQKQHTRADQPTGPTAPTGSSVDPSFRGGGNSSYPTIARSPPPRDSPTARLPPPTSAEHSHSWLTSHGAAGQSTAAETKPATGIGHSSVHAVPITSTGASVDEVRS